jgi:hypothetical protein
MSRVQDEIVVAAGRVLGPERVEGLAAAAEASKDWWLAARYWAIVQSAMPIAAAAGLAPTLRALGALDALGATSESDPDSGLIQDFQLAQVAGLAATWDIGGDLARRPDLVELVCRSKAAGRDPMRVGLIALVTRIVPALKGANAELCGKECFTITMFFLASAQTDPDPVMRSKCFATAYNFTQVSGPMLLHPDFSWDAVYGTNGATMNASFEAYDYDKHHSFLNTNLGGDWYIWWCAPNLPLLQHWGDMARANQNWDRLFEIVRRITQEPNYANEATGLVIGPGVWASLVWSCRLPADQREMIANMMASCQLTWSKADDTIDRGASAVFRPRGDRTADGSYWHSVENIATVAKCGYILMAADPRVSDEEIMLGLPSVEQAIAESCTFPSPVGSCATMTHSLWNQLMLCAAVCEKLGRYDNALVYATAALGPDSAKLGTVVPAERVLLQSIQARSLAALGRISDAAATFEAAAAEAHRYGLFLYEAFALRDLKVCALDGMGHGDHGSRRLGEALRQLTGPTELLTPLLDPPWWIHRGHLCHAVKHFDAAELMAMDVPEPDYEVVFEQTAPVVPVLAGLQQKKADGNNRLVGGPKTVYSRFPIPGVDEVAMENGADGENEKKALIDLIAAQQPPANGGAAADLNESPRRAQVDGLKKELEVLKTSQLKKRAIADHGVSAEQIDDADDSGDPRAAVMGLILAAASAQHVFVDDASVEKERAMEELRSELEVLKTSQLKKRAIADHGVSAEQIDDADDSDDPRAAVTDLILAAASAQHVSVHDA